MSLKAHVHSLPTRRNSETTPQSQGGSAAGQSSLAWQMGARRAGGWEVYFDGDCAFCRRWAMRAQRWCDPRIHWRNFREHDRDVAHLNLQFDQAAYLVINRQMALPGFFAFRKLLLASPRLWMILPFAYFPGSRWIGPMIYDWIARRYGPVRPDAACRIP